MQNLDTPEIWFVTGSQHLYGPATLAQVARDVAVNVLAARPQMGIVRAGVEQFAFQISAVAGLGCTVQTSTNLVAWADLWTTNLPAPNLVWTDSSAGNFPARYYRAVLGP